jgi:hypothetical protein
MNEDLNSPEYWKHLSIGDQISLNDKQSIEDSLDQDESIDGLELTIVGINVINLQDMVEYRVFHLTSPKSTQDLFLILKIVDDAMDIRLYFELDQIEPGTRVDMIENEMHWLFNEPLEPDNFELLDLTYSDMIESPSGEEYDKKLEMHGDIMREPAQSGVENPNLLTLVEYFTEAEVDNDYILFLEEGDSDAGGLITAYAGYNISVNDIEVFRLSHN